MEGRASRTLFYIWPLIENETPTAKVTILVFNEAKEEQSLAGSQLAGKLFVLAAVRSWARPAPRSPYGDNNAYGRALEGSH
jgi:hypothetical protein